VRSLQRQDNFFSYDVHEPFEQRNGRVEMSWHCYHALRRHGWLHLHFCGIKCRKSLLPFPLHSSYCMYDQNPRIVGEWLGELEQREGSSIFLCTRAKYLSGYSNFILTLLSSSTRSCESPLLSPFLFRFQSRRDVVLGGLT